MNNNPLLNEPGINEIYHKNKIRIYNEIITYKNFSFTICHYLSNLSSIPIHNNEIINLMIESFLKIKMKL